MILNFENRKKNTYMKREMPKITADLVRNNLRYYWRVNGVYYLANSENGRAILTRAEPQPMNSVFIYRFDDRALSRLVFQIGVLRTKGSLGEYVVQSPSDFVLNVFERGDQPNLTPNSQVFDFVLIESIPRVTQHFEFAWLNGGPFDLFNQTSKEYLERATIYQPTLKFFTIRRINHYSEVKEVMERLEEPTSRNINFGLVPEVPVQSTPRLDNLLSEYSRTRQEIRNYVEQNGLPETINYKGREYIIIPFSSLNQYMPHVAEYHIDPALKVLAGPGNSMVTLTFADERSVLVKAKVEGSNLLPPV